MAITHNCGFGKCSRESSFQILGAIRTVLLGSAVVTQKDRSARAGAHWSRPTRANTSQRIWRADTFVDFNHGLNNTIKKLLEHPGGVVIRKELQKQSLEDLEGLPLRFDAYAMLAQFTSMYADN